MSFRGMTFSALRKVYCVEITSIKPPVSGKKPIGLSLGKGTDEEIRNNSLAAFIFLSISKPGATREVAGFLINGNYLDSQFCQRSIQQGLVIELGGQLGVDLATDNQRSLLIGFLQKFQGILSMDRVRKKDIQQYVCVNGRYHSSSPDIIKIFVTVCIFLQYAEDFPKSAGFGASFDYEYTLFQGNELHFGMLL